MRKLIMALFLFAVLASFSYAASTILLMDSSGSMDSYVSVSNGTRKKIDVAKDAAYELLNSVSPGDEMALIVFYDCSDIVTEVPFTTNMQTIKSKIAGIEPDSSTPIAKAIKYADSYVKSSGHSGASIVLLSDGEETCDTQAAAVAAAANATNAGSVNMINVVGFDIKSGTAAEQKLTAIAQAGGGQYYSAADADQLGTSLKSAYSAGAGSRNPFGMCCPAPVIGFLALGAVVLRGRKE